MDDKLLFLNIGWMKNYRGLKDGDRIEGGGNFVTQNGFGHEVFNFQPINGKMFGFVEPKTTSARHGRNSLHLEKIEQSAAGKDQIDGVLVIWTALQPETKGTLIVGWYKNATVYRNEQSDIKRPFNNENLGYFIEANGKDCVLLAENYRTKKVPRMGKGWMGRSNIWYANYPNVINYRQGVFDYINENSSPANDVSNVYQPDLDVRKSAEVVPTGRVKIDFKIKKPTQKDFQKQLKEFSKNEERGDLYPVFLRMVEDGYCWEACVFMLSTWNFASFRYAIRGFDFKSFDKTIKKLLPCFKIFLKFNIENINLTEHEADIKKIFNILYEIKGIQSTGAPKLMHLFAPEVFVMWDGYIRKFYGFKKGDDTDYLNFLVKMQKDFSKIKFHSKKITLAKAIDQYNYVKITLPGLAVNKRKRER